MTCAQACPPRRGKGTALSAAQKTSGIRRGGIGISRRGGIGISRRGGIGGSGGISSRGGIDWRGSVSSSGGVSAGGGSGISSVSSIISVSSSGSRGGIAISISRRGGISGSVSGRGGIGISGGFGFFLLCFLESVINMPPMASVRRQGLTVTRRQPGSLHQQPGREYRRHPSG